MVSFYELFLEAHNSIIMLSPLIKMKFNGRALRCSVWL
jgi:hypothetical protein